MTLDSCYVGFHLWLNCFSTVTIFGLFFFKILRRISDIHYLTKKHYYLTTTLTTLLTKNTLNRIHSFSFGDSRISVGSCQFVGSWLVQFPGIRNLLIIQDRIRYLTRTSYKILQELATNLAKILQDLRRLANSLFPGSAALTLNVDLTLLRK